MSFAYRLMYLLGFTPWDAVHPQELTEIIEGPDALPPGRALDIGSGKGAKAIYMATHGWNVTAVDNVPRAVAQARKRAEAARATVDFRLGDVTRLPDLGLEPGFDLMIDFGCFHGLKAAQRDAYARGVTALAAPSGRLLMMAFGRAIPPVSAGVSDTELLERFGASWSLLWSHPDRSAAATSAMKRAAPGWYCLSRR
jgi:cyclopropane fatty-acyl-phospholipid synthase-like methyltransferase